FQAEDGIRDKLVTGVQTCALPIYGGGLHMHVTTSGGKLWRLRYEYGGREKLLSFGPYPEVSLAEAREQRDAAKAMLRDGRDPGRSEERRVGKERRVGVAGLGGNRE